jgi:hypothetical protein
MDQVRIRKMNENEPLMKRQENVLSVKTADIFRSEDSSVADTCVLARGGWRKGGMILIQALLRNRGSHP